MFMSNATELFLDSPDVAVSRLFLACIVVDISLKMRSTFVLKYYFLCLAVD